MFGALKERLQSMQHDITAGFRQLRTKRRLSQRGLSSQASFHLELVNTNAGGELLQRYSTSWHDIHAATESNVEKARHVENDLQRLCAAVESKSDDFMQLQKELRRLAIVSDEISNLITETAKLEGLCEEVESALAYLDVLCHTEEMQNAKLEQRFQLALYREKKMAELNETKTQMALDFMQQNEKLERRRRKQHQEKLSFLQEAVEKDFQTFKSSGVITNSFCASPIIDDSRRPCDTVISDDAPCLPEVFLPTIDANDQLALEAFLSDVKLEDSGIVGDTCGSCEVDDENNTTVAVSR